ncbi:MAG: 3-isopropylmalate/(R)-2-methylmalate dehydratase small subunit [Verrucomicrobia bacterium]|jgi:3-isopropylmalate/(R)-2-methylmalate dehydratase small subunit|nr:MAG: 3-isopropylmalate/(R)-2-methylmalate dehydratase small subunit [Verrucomicrobiota bacterium]
MALAKITSISGRGLAVPGNDIDTDRIIPARFLKAITFDGLGEGLFFDARKAVTAAGQVHPLDDARFRGAKILISGANFGCGSSREHAPQAIQKSGFRAVVAESYAEIFFGNSTTIGLACVSADRADIARLTAAVEANPALEVTVDLVRQEIRFGGQTAKLTMRDSARDALVHGRWDPIGELLEGTEAVVAAASRLPYLAVPQK